jgi:hypothetical protein
LASNSLQSLSSDFCKELRFLVHLYLTYNPLTSISDSNFGFLQNPDLQLIRSDWYIVCCLAAQVKDCKPQDHFVSSCSNLISSTVQKSIILGEAIVITVGNIGAVAVQVLCKEVSLFIMVNLAFGDFLMGVYLLAISSVDLAYYGEFYTIIQQWTQSNTCLFLGLLNFVSSQVSTLLLCILSVARMVSIEKIRGMQLLKSKIWKICLGAWVVTSAMGTTYTLLILQRQGGAHNNLCILIGLSKHYHGISSLERVFQVLFIVSNVMILGLIVVSMAYVFTVVAKSARSVMQVGGDQNKARNSNLMIVGRRLILLLVCNVLSWFPFLMVSALLLAGIRVHDYVVQWIVILGVPISALTDPFLYSIASMKVYIKNKK